MSFPPLAGGDHSILSSEFCSGYVDVSGNWNTGFYCPQTGSTLAVYCCGTPTFKYCCTNKPLNGTGSGIVEDITLGTFTNGAATSITSLDGDDGTIIDGGDYSGATRIRPINENKDLSTSDLTSLNLSDVPIIFGVACGVAAVLILVILAGFYLTSCCAHYHKLHQNRKRRSSVPGIYRGSGNANTSTSSGLVNLYSPTNSGGTGTGGAAGPGSGLLSSDNTQTYIVHHHHPSNPPASPDSCSTPGDHYQSAGGGGGGASGGGSTSLVTTPLDIEWSATVQYLQKPPQQQLQGNKCSSTSSQYMLQQPMNVLSTNPNDQIQYTVHQTQNRLAVALTGSMNRLSDRASPCPTPSNYPVNIPLTPPDGYSYPRPMTRGFSPPPQYSSAILARGESPPYYPSYDSGSSSNNTDNQHNYLSRTSTLPLSLSRKPPAGAGRPLVTSPGPYCGSGSVVTTPQQPKSILRTSQNYRKVVTNETPPPIPPHLQPGFFTGPIVQYNGGGTSSSGGSLDGGNIAYRNVNSRTNLSSQPLLLLENKVDNSRVEVEEDEDDRGDREDDNPEARGDIRRGSISTGVNTTISTTSHVEDEEDESRDQFDIHDIDSDALSRLIEMDLDSKL